MKVYKTDEIKNVALVGGAKSGKTTLAEAMLFEGKVIDRKGSVDDKNSVSDYRDIEIKKQNSVHSTIMYTEFDGKKINIIDTPGFNDYVGEVVSALSVVETALLVTNTHVGVDATTENAWRQAEKSNSPVLFIANQLDHEKANFDSTVSQLKEFFGDKVSRAQYPVNAGEGFDSIIDLVLNKMLKFPKGGGACEIVDIPASEADKAAELSLKLMENAAAGSDELMEKYFENDKLTLEEMREGIRLGMRTRAIFPIFCTSAKTGVGVNRLMDFVNHSCPAPSGRPRTATDGTVFTCSQSDPTAFFVFKTSVEPHMGEVSYFKVYGGKVTEGMDLINSRHGNKERLPQLMVVAGKKRDKVAEVYPGDIASAIKLKDTKTNDTLVDAKISGLKFEPIPFPEPIASTAVKAKASADDEKMGSILNDMRKSDPTIIVEHSRELRQIILKGQGELHLNTIKWYFDNVYHIDIEYYAPKIPYRETITKSAYADYRHKKQSGGSGQFGEVHMFIQPYSEDMPKPTDFPVRGTEEHELPWGGKLVFNNCIVGGAIDARFNPAILKGIMERMDQGPLTGSYARDISVYIYDGKMHPVDSNEISFKLAGRFAFSDAFKHAGPKIMEPVYDLSIRVPEDNMGAVMTDIQGRRAMIMGMEADGHYQIIKAKVPLAEMHRYSTSLSSLTSGRGTFSMTYDQYQQVPTDVQDKLLKEYEESLDEED
ncbi:MULTISPECIES: translation factor GTPase family protein [unclassified Lentimicrobium]|uniref:elongation factor G n=1 Tax=unclassified Lentimicrobium TaxID=2677434 RepID=UPI001552D304|nr:MULTISPECIES: elongation factor G [unclassified Lentimicrobium]NPD44938.1 elongation factor G [Lentimicrobium sp. S6]NPD85867.1 elongation factor G [Lentimicrobium sp. L6]